jgi:hypothetical protein
MELAMGEAGLESLSLFLLWEVLGGEEEKKREPQSITHMEGGS